MEIFISHSSKDKKFGNALVKLLCDLGINRRKIIYTSNNEFGIPKGENIFKWLKSKLTSKPYVIYIVSDNYYSSIPCLNEMGAAWVIENEHSVLIMPGFDINDDKFRSGAIDPREMVIFADNEHDIYDFVELIKSKMKLDISLSTIKKNVDLYIDTVTKIDLSNTQNKNSNQNNSITTYSSFITDLNKNKITDVEILLLRYMSDEGKFILGDRWMAEQEIKDIIKWEVKNNLLPCVSNNYYKALNRFKARKLLVVESTTEYGNPREYKLLTNITENIIILDEILNEASNIALKPYSIYK